MLVFSIDFSDIIGGSLAVNTNRFTLHALSCACLGAMLVFFFFQITGGPVAVKRHEVVNIDVIRKYIPRELQSALNYKKTYKGNILNSTRLGNIKFMLLVF